MNSFLEELEKHDIKALAGSATAFSTANVKAALSSSHIGLREFLSLLSPAASDMLEALAQRARSITLSRFGRVIQLYSPLYLSNYCQNNCLYCGFRKDNPMERKILPPAAIVKEAGFLFDQGFRSILLVAGDDPETCGLEYLRDAVSRIHEFLPSVSLEIGPQSLENYIELRKAGAEGVVIYQETYNKELYQRLHPEGKKRDYAWRMGTPERVALAGFHRVGIGALLGLGDPIEEAAALFLHASFMLKRHWKTRLTISFPRMRQAQGSIKPLYPVDDRSFARIICAFRIAFPDVGIVLSTREEPKLRDGAVQLGVTHLSAGSRTEPGGYLEPDQRKEQFHVEDGRSPAEVAEMLASNGYDPVWKDWEAVLV